MKKNKFINWFNKPKTKSTEIEYGDIKFISSLADVPEDMGMNIFVVKSSGKYKWVIFQCPDNCGNHVEANLMKSKYPFWTLKIRKNKASISPSLIVKGCNSHFWLKDSRVQWAKLDNE